MRCSGIVQSFRVIFGRRVPVLQGSSSGKHEYISKTLRIYIGPRVLFDVYVHAHDQFLSYWDENRSV